MSQPVIFFFAFLAVLALIGAAAWLVRRFAGNRLGANANRGRMPRLAVIDAAAIDGRRRLVLVRRDNVEHLLMIGGPADLVVEPNIVRATAGREQPPRPLSAEPRQPAAETPSWEPEPPRAENFDHPEPQLPPPPPPRPSRPPFADEVRRPAPPPERRAEPIPGSMPEPLRRPEPRLDLRADPPLRMREPMMPRSSPAEPPVPKAPPVRVTERITERAAERVAERLPAPAPALLSQSAVAAADQNLADMAQRLEAALRRPAAEPRGEAAEPRIGAPPVAPEPPNRGASRAGAAESARQEPSPPAPPPAKSGFENLEDEMASLLGRPKSPT